MKEYLSEIPGMVLHVFFPSVDGLWIHKMLNLQIKQGTVIFHYDNFCLQPVIFSFSPTINIF